VSSTTTPTPEAPARDGVTLLIDFHQRIRAELSTLAAIAADLVRHDADAILEAADLAEQIVSTFGREGRLHARDEEESLFPRLGARLVLEPDDEVEQALALAIEEHAHPDAIWLRVRAWLWQVRAPDGIVSIDQFAAEVRALAACYGPHLEREERILFPAAQRLLQPEERLVIAEEVDARRRAPGRPVWGDAFAP
jgi:iron-sulfur cluster repair protein YtfE (RIC family)